MKLLLATNNKKKLRELMRIVQTHSLPLEICTLSDIPPYEEPVESEWTFEGNAALKAKAGAEHSGLPTLADDSGLCIDALNQMPGVRSARWAGSHGDDQANTDLVLRQIDDVDEESRRARFVCSCVLAFPDGRLFSTEGTMEGYIATSARGDRGFGYDPIFIPLEGNDQNLTSAQMSDETKDAISHRGKALRAMVPIIAEQICDMTITEGEQ